MTASPPTPETIVNLRLAEVHPAADNVRADVGDVTELAASIAEVGVLEPLIVIPSVGNGGGFTVVVGHRRLAGAKLAGVPYVPAIIRKLEERERVMAMVVENLQRQDLTPLEEATAYRRLVELGLGQVELARRVGRSQALVSKRLALLKLPDVARTALVAGKLTLEDAGALVGEEEEVVTRTLKYVGELRGEPYAGQVKRIVEGTREEVREARARETALKGLAAAKVSIVKTDQYDRPIASVTGLGKGWRMIPMSAATHKKEPCHAAYVTHRGEVVYVCTKPSNHLKAEAKEVAKAAREIAGVKTGAGGKLIKEGAAKAAATRERNKVLKVAAPIRQRLAVQLLKPSKVRREAIEFALRQLIQTALDTKPELGRIAAELLELKAKDQDGDPNFKALASSPAGIDRLAYALALAAGEAPFRQLVARSYFAEDFSSHAARYFAHLKAANYKATPTELAQIKPTAWRAPFDGTAGK